MIKSWANAASRKVYEGERPNRFAGLDFETAAVQLDTLNVTKTLRDISPLRSVGLHKLKGDRKGQWATTINGPWRVCFTFRDGHAYDVEVVDYHKG